MELTRTRGLRCQLPECCVVDVPSFRSAVRAEQDRGRRISAQTHEPVRLPAHSNPTANVRERESQPWRCALQKQDLLAKRQITSTSAMSSKWKLNKTSAVPLRNLPLHATSTRQSRFTLAGLPFSVIDEVCEMSHILCHVVCVILSAT